MKLCCCAVSLKLRLSTCCAGRFEPCVWHGGAGSAEARSDVVTDTGQVRDKIHLRRADQTKRGHARTVFVSERRRRALQRYVHSTQQRAGDWAFFYTQQKPRRGFTAKALAYACSCA